MATPLQAPYAQFFDSNGDPLSGGKVYTYVAGTTTPKATYTDADEGTQAANPIILDSSGRAAIWITGTYRIDVYTSADVLVRSVDDVPAFTAGGDMTKAVYDPANIFQQVVGTTATQTLTNKSLSDSTTQIIDNSDATKIAKFECSGITTGTTRTYTFPDSSGTLALASGGSSISQVVTQVFTSSSTYTPTSGMKYCIVEVVGGGGGGRGSTNGGNGGNTTFGALLTANGGTGGQAGAGGAGGSASSGDVNITGQNGSRAIIGFLAASSGGTASTAVCIPGVGGSSPLGPGGVAGTADATGTGYGAGGSTDYTAPAIGDVGGGSGGYARKAFPAATIGASQAVTIGAAGAAGSGAGAGTAGICIITEFL